MTFWEWLLDIAKLGLPEPIVGRWHIGPVRLANTPKKIGFRGLKPKQKGEIHMILTDEQQVPLSVKFVTEAGNPARIDGEPQWQSSNPGVVELIPNPDLPANEFARIARRVGPTGMSQISCKADADLGSGTREVIATADIEVVAAEAVKAIIEAGTPVVVPKPPGNGA